MIIGRGCWAEPGTGLLLIDTGDATADCITAQALMLRGESELGEPWARLLVLGLALLYLGRQDAVEATLEARPATGTPVLFGDARLSVIQSCKCMWTTVTESRRGKITHRTFVPERLRCAW